MADVASAPVSTLERLIGGYMALRDQRLDERLQIAQVSQPALRTTVQQPTQPGANPSPAIGAPVGAGPTSGPLAGVSWLWIGIVLVVLVGVFVALRKR